MCKCTIRKIGVERNANLIAMAKVGFDQLINEVVNVNAVLASEI